jgi:hypothetical protein
MNNRKRVCIVAAALFLSRYALAHVGMEEVWSTINKSNVSKTAVKIGVIDSGIDASGKRHPEFRNR